MKRYLNFITESLSEQYSKKIVNYINKNTNIKLYEYGEIFKVKKSGSNTTLDGKLYLMVDGRAIRFNFYKNTLISVDLWNKLEFDYERILNKPNYTFNTTGSYLSVSQDVIDFINGTYRKNEKITLNDVEIAPDEKVNLNSIDANKNIMDFNIDTFETIKLFTMQVASKISRSLVVSGMPGIGKTTIIENTLEEMHVTYEAYAGGDVSTSALYKLLFLNRHNLLLLDDIDDIFDQKASVNLLKAVLDTKKRRMVSRLIATNFRSDGMTDEEIQAEYEKTGKLPNKFEYFGEIIFITNRPGESLDAAFRTRGLFVDVQPTKEEVIKKISSTMPNILPNVKIEIKQEVLDLMVLMQERFELRFPIDLRTFVHCLNIRIANDFKTKIGEESIPMYQLLIKKYMIK